MRRKHGSSTNANTGARHVVALGLTLGVLTACGCGEGARTDAATKRTFSKGMLGVWVVRTDATLDGITAIPSEVAQFTDLAAYKAWLRQKVEGLQFEFYPDNKVFLRFPEGKGPSVDGSLVWEFKWERREDGSYRLVEPGPYIPLLSQLGQPVSHRFKMSDPDSAICQYQVQWSENSAPRSPLVLEKTWE